MPTHTHTHRGIFGYTQRDVIINSRCSICYYIEKKCSEGESRKRYVEGIGKLLPCQHAEAE